jgi:hypothetical protein
MIHNFLKAPKIMDYENTIYSIAPILEGLNFWTLFYGQPRQFFEGVSYQQIVQWELFHK